MKCELCRDKKATGNGLCVSCGEMILHVISFETRLRNEQVREAERQQCQSSLQQIAFVSSQA
jgi:hypothetical protein